ncbi:hypothetical protein PM082_004855 [Marasmius tenuissimus]|nr:hypothetical protein PM082_004855 [Marasmius tenuissimus]
MDMVALHTIVCDMDDDFFDFASPRAGHVEDVEFEELLLDDDVVNCKSALSSSLGYWESIGDLEREFRWRMEYGDEGWSFDKALYTEKEKSMWRVRSGLKKKVEILRRRF